MAKARRRARSLGAGHGELLVARRRRGRAQPAPSTRLLGLGSQPLALAVIPAEMAPALAGLSRRPAGSTCCSMAMPIATTSRRRPRRRSWAPPVPLLRCCEELGRGARLLAAAFGTQALPVLVPPWNRIAEPVIDLLAGEGYRGLSTQGFQPPEAASWRRGILQVNTHVDIVDWRGGRGFIGARPRSSGPSAISRPGARGGRRRRAHRASDPSSGAGGRGLRFHGRIPGADGRTSGRAMAFGQRYLRPGNRFRRGMKEYRYPHQPHPRRLSARRGRDADVHRAHHPGVICHLYRCHMRCIDGGLRAVHHTHGVPAPNAHSGRRRGLTVRGGPVRQMKWQELDGLTLRYYSARRNRKDGWMTLGLKSRGRSLAIDSHIEGFETLARLAADAAASPWPRARPHDPQQFRRHGSGAARAGRRLGAGSMKDLLSVEDLAISFNVHGGKVDAVRGVSFRVPVGGTVASSANPAPASRSSARRSWASCRPRPSSAAARSCSAIRRPRAGPSTSPRLPQEPRRCAPSAAGASPSSSRSR